MSVNLLGRVIPCKNRLFLKHVFHNFATEYPKNPVLCSCTLSTLATNLTSKERQNSYSKVHFRRYSSEERPPPSTRLPPLMNFPQIVWPSIFKSIRNFILTTFIIKPYFEREFSLAEFVSGSKKALEVVSHKISEGDLKSLDTLVTKDVALEVQRAVSLMSLTQREQIAVNSDDVYFSFPYQIGIIFDEEDREQKRFVEITMVFHALRGLALMRSNGEEPPINMGVMPEYKTRISISNYRFIREYTKGVESDWTVNMLNHFKPSDELED